MSGADRGAAGHRPVLLKETLGVLQPRPGGVYVDCTFGRGGHTAAILESIGRGGRVIAIDRDPEAVREAQALAARDPRLQVFQGPFSTLEQCVGEARGAVDGVVFDLGVSSPQLDQPQRGFSFLRDGPLDMRMDPTSGVSAAQWLAEASRGEIAGVLKRYGEEPFASRIAAAIVAAREQAPIRTTGELAAIVARAVPAKSTDRHPATLTFQALRIHVNQELEELAAGLRQALSVLAPGGRVAVISFHSLEDRMVKRFFRDEARGDPYPPGVPVPASALRPRLRVLKGAVHATPEEVAANPRARSAVLRAAERL